MPAKKGDAQLSFVDFWVARVGGANYRASIDHASRISGVRGARPHFKSSSCQSPGSARSPSFGLPTVCLSSTGGQGCYRPPRERREEPCRRHTGKFSENIDPSVLDSDAVPESCLNTSSRRSKIGLHLRASRRTCSDRPTRMLSSRLACASTLASITHPVWSPTTY